MMQFWKGLVLITKTSKAIPKNRNKRKRRRRNSEEKTGCEMKAVNQLPRWVHPSYKLSIFIIHVFTYSVKSKIKRGEREKEGVVMAGGEGGRKG